MPSNEHRNGAPEAGMETGQGETMHAIDMKWADVEVEDLLCDAGAVSVLNNLSTKKVLEMLDLCRSGASDAAVDEVREEIIALDKALDALGAR